MLINMEIVNKKTVKRTEIIQSEMSHSLTAYFDLHFKKIDFHLNYFDCILMDELKSIFIFPYDNKQTN